MNELNRKFQQEAELIASRRPPAEFYARFIAPIATSKKLYFGDPLVLLTRKTVEPILCEDLGHGLFHSSRVALDASTLIFIESESHAYAPHFVERLMTLALVTGLLHDICRKCERHAEAGAVEAARLLKDLPVTNEEARGICRAIRNHEAFLDPVPSKRPWFQLMSDCLYDADKFRWGVDTFTHTLWFMADSQGLTPEQLIERFPWGVNGVSRIAETFRTPTGRQFGPDIIYMGVEIGKEIYRYLLHHYGKGNHDGA